MTGAALTAGIRLVAVDDSIHLRYRFDSAACSSSTSAQLDLDLVTVVSVQRLGHCTVLHRCRSAIYNDINVLCYMPRTSTHLPLLPATCAHLVYALYLRFRCCTAHVSPRGQVRAFLADWLRAFFCQQVPAVSGSFYAACFTTDSAPLSRYSAVRHSNDTASRVEYLFLSAALVVASRTTIPFTVTRAVPHRAIFGNSAADRRRYRAFHL